MLLLGSALGFPPEDPGLSPTAPAALPLVAQRELSAQLEGTIVHYDCAPQLSLGGPEQVEWIELDQPGLLRVELSSDGKDGLHLLLLRDPTVQDERATGCLAHGADLIVEPALPAGRYLLVVDSEEPAPATALPYQLAVEQLPAGAWTRWPLAPGIEWARHWDPSIPRTISLLQVAPEARDALVIRRHDSCEPIAAMAERIGALAGINAAFFSMGCEPLCLLASEGRTIAQSHMGKGPQRTLGWYADDPLGWAWVDEDLNWPGVDFAVAGYPSLVRAGEAWVDPADTSSFQTHRHPRSAIGVTAQGAILLVAVDGRTELSAGVTMDELAALMVKLGAVDAVNLDGGGSTTLWIRGAWPGGVVNHPSDNEQADHLGARAVSDGIYVLPPSPSSERSTGVVGGSSENNAR